MPVHFHSWKKKRTEKRKSAAREWADAVMFAVVFASLIRWATFEAYAIPTSSMEKSLLVGDNQDNSTDSRYWGFVPEGHVVGKVMFVWL